jgi:gliding motility-associated-like protein
MRKKILFALFIFFCISNQKTFALELQVNATNETCTGNGTLTFVISDFDSNAPVFYSVYLLPNTTTPLATVSTNSLNGLEAGNYLVIASQTLNGVETTDSQNATILDNIVPLTFSITGTNVLCGNDGTITVNASSTAVSYQILAGPITTGIQSSNLFTGLQAGIYNIRVVDNCGDGIVQAFTLLTTTSSLQILPPNFVDVLNCNSISVFHNFNAGSATQVAFPLTVQTTVNPPTGPPSVTTQVIPSGNVINLIIPYQNDQSYPYNLLITDNCGNTYSLNNNIVDFDLIGVSNPSINDSDQLSSCSSLDVLHTLLLDVDHQFLYPITVQTTVNPPTGPPIVTNQTITSGTSINLNIPMENNESYSYDLLITDACGNVVVLNGNVLEVPFDIDAVVGIAGCDDNFVNISLENYLPPFNVNFISTPVGFNPVDFNANYPGPYNGGGVNFGGLNNSLPEGSYLVEVTDSCGNTSQQVFIVEEPQTPIVESSSTSSECGGNTGSLSLYFSPIRAISTIVLTAAPSSYTSPLPQDVFSFVVTNNILFMEDLPAGSYSFDLTDACGTLYSHTVIVGGISGNIFLGNRHGCEVGFTSVVISVQNSEITFIEILDAPSSFGFALPYDISANIATNGSLYMNSLPAGFYRFRIVDNCGADRIFERTLLGLNVENTGLDITENCGSFNLGLAYISSASSQSYWLQKYNPQDNVWEHPGTGFDYVSGANLTTTNAVQLINNTNNINLAYSGLFRIVKAFLNYSNGVTNLNRCILVLDEFEFNGGPKIIDALAFPCQNNTQEVVVIAQGLPPLEYSITSKNNVPFVVNNGNSNTFYGLEPAIYNFRVEDVCGNFVNRVFDVTLLPEPSIIASGLCDGNNGQLEIQDFPFVNYEWYNVQNPSVILSTSNTLQFSPFNSSVDVGTYAVQLSTTNANSCINQTIQYTINPSGFNPNAGEDNSLSVCREDQQIGLNTFLTNPHDNGGVWTDSNGAIVSAIINPLDFSVGDYEFTYTVNGFCALSDSASIIITIKDLPATPVLTFPSPICRGDIVQLNADLVANATYFWTGPNGFTSTEQNPAIQDFNENNDGSYFVYITVDGCNSATEEIIVNSNPLPDFSIDGATSLCLGLSETLTINPSNFNTTLASISWYFNDILLSTETSSNLQINQIGTYKSIVNINGCSSEREIEVIEKVNSFEVVLEHGCNGNDYEIKVVNAADFPNATYSWTGPNGFVSFSQNIIVPNLQFGNYNVEVEDVLGCKSSNFALVENTNCFIPNGFSPDDDGINDYFDLTGYGVKKIYIYNRYGRLIYDKDNYINEWKGQTNDNKRVPAATYFYVLEFNEGENKTGWVYVSY